MPARPLGRAVIGAAFRIDGRLVAREAFYAAACDPQRSVVVQACAGAGKTWMLVSRIVRALLAGAEPHEILAITFTRRAAGEMRDRLDEWLAEFASPATSDAERTRALRERGLDEAAALAAAPHLQALHERVLRGGRPVEIRTFHAWFSQLLRAAPLELLNELGLQADMALIEDVEEHSVEVYRRFHAAVLRDAALHADYEALVAERGRSVARQWLDAAWRKRIEIELADAAGVLDGSVPSAAKHWPEYAPYAHPAQRLRQPLVQALMLDVASALGAQDKATPRKQAALLLQAFEHADDPAALAAARMALLTKQGELRKHLSAPGLEEVVAFLNDIQRAADQQTAHEGHLRMARLARVLLAEFAAYKRSRGLADMADLERCALALLRDSALSGWVQERLDSRVRHLLIDEFQDTSPLQWQALHSWLSAYAGAGGGGSGQRPPGVFIVGDAKQSIYRFRRAEPRVFDAALAFVEQGLGGAVLECDHTRRNAPGILAALNPVFEAAVEAGEFEGFRAHTTQVAGGPLPALHALPQVPRPAAAAAALVATWRNSLTTPRHEPEEALRQHEARAVAHAVQALLSDGVYAAGDIFVLCRKRASLRWVAQALQAVHLPFSAVEDATLMDAAEVRDLVAVLDALVSPSHALSLAHALRSPVFGAADEDLMQLALRAGRGGDWWQALTQGAHDSAALRRASALMLRWQSAAETLPPHDLLDRVVAEGEVHARVAAAVPPERRRAALDAIDSLLGQALTLDGARYATPYNFVRALKRRAVKTTLPAQADAVQLLTIHGAKGLEAKVVFVVDADPEPNRAATATLLVEWPVDSSHPTRCAFVAAESQCPASLNELLALEHLARQREELNGLYVAMTRARERLVVSATEPHKKNSGVSWWRRLEPFATPWTPPAVDATPLARSEGSVSILELPAWQARPVGRVAPPEPEAAPLDAQSIDASASGAQGLGRAVHRVLEWATGPRPFADLGALAAAAAQMWSVSAEGVARHAEQILRSPACARFFAGDALLWSGNEVAVSEGGDALRIDRLVALALPAAAGGREWWVLDYKLHHTPEALAAYRDQLLRYRLAVQALQPGEAVRCAFITGSGEVVELSGA